MAETLPLDDSLVVAELGCGPAFVAEAVAPRVRRLVGFEIASDTIEALGRHDLPANLDLVPGDACKTECFVGFSRAFDLVYSTDTLEHVADPEAFFATVRAILKPGGLAVIVFPNEPPDSRHGDTSFATGAELMAALGEGLSLRRAAVVTRTAWSRFLHSWGWKTPLRLAKRLAGLKPLVEHPQAFDQTVAGRHGFRPRRLFSLLNVYGKTLVAMSGERAGFRLTPLAIEPETPLFSRYLWLELVRSSTP